MYPPLILSFFPYSNWSFNKHVRIQGLERGKHKEKKRRQCNSKQGSLKEHEEITQKQFASLKLCIIHKSRAGCRKTANSTFPLVRNPTHRSSAENPKRFLCKQISIQTRPIGAHRKSFLCTFNMWNLLALHKIWLSSRELVQIINNIKLSPQISMHAIRNHMLCFLSGNEIYLKSFSICSHQISNFTRCKRFTALMSQP